LLSGIGNISYRLKETLFFSVNGYGFFSAVIRAGRGNIPETEGVGRKREFLEIITKICNNN